MKLAIVGSRGFDNYELMSESLEIYVGMATLVISGGAQGADSLGAKWGRENNLPIQIFLPDWEKHGKSAGYKRNIDIVKNADVVVAFWDGESKGTKHSMDIAEEMGIKLVTVLYE